MAKKVPIGNIYDQLCGAAHHGGVGHKAVQAWLQRGRRSMHEAKNRRTELAFVEICGLYDADPDEARKLLIARTSGRRSR